MSGFYQSYAKRPLDLLAASALLLLLAPLLLVVALLIILEDGHHPLFTQLRTGRRNTTFTLYKFRSMKKGTDSVPSALATSLPITKVGKFIRRSNIDELPQLFNVMKGDMSLVGPRPSLPSQAKLNELRRRNGATECRPGLTGLAQVNSYDGMTEDKKAAFDAEYARSVSLVQDVTILIRTVGYLTRRPPVY